MIIKPIKYIPHGDVNECENLKGQANRVMLILENIMQLRKLDQYLIRFIPYDGALIIARKFFGIRVIDIYAGVKQLPISIKAEKICICNCNFSVGWIFEIQEGETIEGAQLYTVMACNNSGRAYIKYTDVLASDYTQYKVGDKIVMIPYNQMAYLCCTDSSGGENEIRGCSPLISTKSTDSADWRTTYRIIPICAMMIPKQVDKNRFNTNG